MFKRIYTIEDITAEFPNKFTPDEWTAIIPAAGRGSRLGFDKAKILFPILGKTILEWQVSLLSPFCTNFIYILSPASIPELHLYLEKLIPKRYRIIPQKEPLGMGDAIWQAFGAIETKHSLIMWGDQIGFQRETIELSVRAHENRSHAHLTLPSILTQNPYIHFVRNNEGKIIKVLQAREGDLMPTTGESDAGFFLFSTDTLFKHLEDYRFHKDVQGLKTKEFNFLPLFPFFDDKKGDLITLRILDKKEVGGINTQEDARLMSSILLQRSQPTD